MRPAFRRGFGTFALPIVGFVIALSLFPEQRALIVHAFALIMLGIGLLWFVAAVYAATAPSGPSPFEDALTWHAPEPEGLAELHRLEREVQLGAASAFDLHYRLVPVLRDIARGLLATRRGIDLDRRPLQAREALGDEAWTLVRPDREPPEDRLAVGPGIAPIASTVDALEAL